MKQLSGVDAAFLYMESGTQFGHVSGLGIFARPDDPDWSPYEVMRDKLSRRLPDLDPLRRRLVEVPLRLDHPVLDRGPRLRPRVPPPRVGVARARDRREAGPAGGPPRRAAPGPGPSAVGGLRDRGAQRQPLCRPDQTAPRHHRRRGRRRADEDPLRPRAGDYRRPGPGHPACRPTGCRARLRSCRGRSVEWCASPASSSGYRCGPCGPWAN